jgi:PA14 domain/Bacterial toxin 44/Putative amidase domain/FG-GAP-like repeat
MPLNSDNLNLARTLDLSTTNRVLSDGISGSNPVDSYRITVSQASDLKISLQGLKANADLQVIRDANGNGKIDAREVLLSSALKGVGLDAINLSLAAGNYYVQVYAGDQGATTTYSLNYSATALGTADSTDLTATRSYFGTGVVRSFYTNRGISLYQKPAGQVVAFGNAQPAPSNFLMYGAIGDYYTNNYAKNSSTTNGLTGVTSGLGNPTSAIYEQADGSSAMDFEGGQLVSRNAVVTAIYSKLGGDRFDLVGQGAPNGTELQWKDDYAWFGRNVMGQATGAVRRTSGGYVQEFTGGSAGDGILTLKDGQQVLGGTEKYTDDLGKLVDQAKGGPYKVQGEILRVYRSMGGFDQAVGGLGYATMSSERLNFKGYKAYQEFENGSIGVAKDGKIVIQDRQGKVLTPNATDFNGDGRTDIFWRNAATGENLIWQMNGNIHSGDLKVDRFADLNWKVVGTGDFDGDGRTDLLWRNMATGENLVWRMNGGTHLGDLKIDKITGPGWQIVGAADFDGDGKTDIVWRNGVTGENLIWKMNGVVHVSDLKVSAVTDPNWRIVGLADFDGDRRTDILWRNSVSGENLIWQMNGGTHLGDLSVDKVSEVSWQVVSTADFDGDGKADILWRNGVTGENLVWKMNGNNHASDLKVEQVLDTNWKVSGGGSDNPVAPTNMFWAEYFNNNALTGQAVYTKIDVGINYDWGTGGPGYGIGNDNFSVRWTGKFTFDAGDYRFFNSVDDGMRLWVDGNLIHDTWNVRRAVDYSKLVSLSAGVHDIKVEYNELTGLAVAKIGWEKAPAVNQFKAEYFNNQTLTGNPTVVRNEKEINYDWGLGSPVAGIGGDHFSARWTGVFKFDEGNYLFRERADDGVRMWLDNQLIIDSWKDQPASDFGTYRFLSAGDHKVQVDYFDDGLAATAKAWWQKSDVWKAEYFGNQNLAGTATTKESFGDSTQGLSKDWGFGGPTNTPVDHFSGRFTTTRWLDPGFYKIETQADDGIRVRVGDKTVIDRWAINGQFWDSGFFRSNGGDTPITIEYYEDGGAASLNFNIKPVQKFWDSVDVSTNWNASVFAWDPSQGNQPPLDFFKDDFNNPNIIGVTNLGSNTRSDGKKGFSADWGTRALNNDGARLPDDFYAVRAYTTADFDGSEYKFRARGDDGFQILAKKQNTNDWFYITPQNSWEQAYGDAKEYTFKLPQGRYDLHYHFFEGAGNAYFDMSWEKAQPAGSGQGGSNYDRQAAVDYANRYSTARNSAYHDYSNEGGNCANFVSQCLIQGHELPTTHINANELRNYLVGQGLAREVGSVNELQAGDVVAYSWDGGPIMDHIALYLGNGQVASNTVDGIWDWREGVGSSRYPNGKTVLLHINASGTQSTLLNNSTVQSSGWRQTPNLHLESFSGVVMPTAGVNLRKDPHIRADNVDGGRAYNSRLTFDAWTTGDSANDYRTGGSDNRWFHVVGTEDWVSSAMIDGNPPSLSGQPIPYTPPVQVPTSGDYTHENFSGTVMPSEGARLRFGTNTSAGIDRVSAYNTRLSFDGWTIGETVNDYRVGTPDSVWFHVAGTEDWVSSAMIDGNPPSLLIQVPDAGDNRNNSGSTVSLPIAKPDPRLTNQIPNLGSSSVPKAISYIWSEIDFNRCSVALDVIAGYNQKAGNALTRLKGFTSSPTDILGEAQAVGLVVEYLYNKGCALKAWYDKVQSGGIWDHKSRSIELNKAEFGGNGQWSSVIGSNGDYQKYNYQIWSNMHYGYIGMLAGFSQQTLLGGAGLAQMKTNLAAAGISWDHIDKAVNILKGSNPNATWYNLPSIDDPADQKAIHLGIDLFDNYKDYVNEAQFLAKVYSSGIDKAYPA